ncbi:MAG: DNA repair protein RadC [Arcticibacterium sp.]|jgi:DNA repair protein RadC
MPYETKPSIPHWAEEDRPREKLLMKGRTALTDSEIIAILIGSGSRGKSAVELARDILAFYQNDLNKLARASIKELMNFKGIGEAKAISICSALELGRRRKDKEEAKAIFIDGPLSVYQYFKPVLLDLPHEEFWVLLLGRSNKVLKAEKVGQGGVTAVLADPKIIFKTAIENLASSIILVHNHPSGKLVPSSADVSLTHKLVEAGKLLDITVADHVIFSNTDFYSFSNEDNMEA